MKTKHGERVLEYGSRRIAYQLTTSERKKLRITVEPDLTVKVDAPNGFEEDEITSRGRWLVRQIDEVTSFHPLPTPYRFSI